jgi:pimeloyl-ACP methyl ester carboxylesterase
MTTSAASSSFPRVSDAAITGLRQRLRFRSEIRDPWTGDRSRGIGEAELGPLLAHWADGFDWRAQEERIAALPWRLVGHGNRAVRLIHQRSAREDAPTVVLLHGWPDSVLRFERVLPLLRDVHVVAPALPGFPFSEPLAEPASVDVVAELVAEALESLGSARYTVSAGDVGGDVAEVLADRHPDQIASMHLTNVSARHLFAVDPAELKPAAKAYFESAMAWNRQHGAYVAEQATRPRTLLTALGDSPTALAAWLLEKITDWTDNPDTVFSPDELLTWVSAYWFTDSIGTSFATYAEPFTIPRRTDVPTVISAFAHDTKPAPREWAEQFVQVARFVPHAAGGHFAAWEQPQQYADDLMSAVELAR